MKQDILLAVIFLLTVTGCKKFLEEKPDKKLAVISKSDELQSLLDHSAFVNFREPVSGELSSDDYYITDNEYNTVYSEFQNRLYTWEKEFVFPEVNNDWYNLYRCIYRANTVLDNLGNAEPASSDNVLDDIKGQALFLRGRSLLAGSFIWSQAYDAATASIDLGLPIRSNSDFNEPSVRSSVKETYEQIIYDLKEAATLLPDIVIHKIRPTRQAAFAMLARTFLSMRDYDAAWLYADSCLQISATLIDYNDPAIAFPDRYYGFRQFNDEVITVTGMEIPELLSAYIGRTDSIFYSSYDDNDMRKQIYFIDNGDGSVSFKGSYDSWKSLFSSVATDEMFLIRAECSARKNRLQEAINDLNTLLEKRWKTGTFQPYVATDSVETLNIILKERRKELTMRGLRWMDIKRLNKEGYNISLKRVVNGEEYALIPGDSRFALPLPEDVIRLSGMIQNPK